MTKTNQATAIFAGGCFWCMVEPFDQMPGIISVTSGYTGGHTENPTYKEVAAETTGHYEAVKIIYDPDVFPYEKLVELFWQQIDPTDAGGQFNDRGKSYQTAIFYQDNKQKEIAEQSKQDLEKSGKFDKPIVTKILPAETFYPAEEEHQDYYKKNQYHYKRYKKGSGREDFIRTNWKLKFSKEELKKQLTPIQYHVTQENGTERPYENEYHDHEEDGIYVDRISGEPLFSSLDKYDAGCGWPSFTKPINKNEIEELLDTSHGMRRVEIRSKTADSHLGHVFNDGPVEEGGMRYCMNSAALKFIPKDKLADEGYEIYKKLFE